MNDISIVRARLHDVSCIMGIMEEAKGIMRADGNPTQWPEGYPATQTIEADIASGSGYLCVSNGVAVAYFAFLKGPDPTYTDIQGGSWLAPSRP